MSLFCRIPAFKSPSQFLMFQRRFISCACQAKQVPFGRIGFANEKIKVTPSSSLFYSSSLNPHDVTNELAKKDKIMTVPNALCVLRMLSAPAISYLIFSNQYGFACLLFSLAGFTDLIDGYIARKVPSQASKIGSILDPLADKILICTTFVTLICVNCIPVYLASVVILRDVLLVIGSFAIRFKTLERPLTLNRFFNPSISPISVHPTKISKLNTLLQICVVASAMAAPVFQFVDHSALSFLYVATGSTTVWSFLQYLSSSAIRVGK